MYLMEDIRPYLKAASVIARAGDRVHIISTYGEVCMCQTEIGAKFSVHSSKLSDSKPTLIGKIHLSDQQNSIVEFMKLNPGSFLRPFKSLSGAKCYRLLDAKINPIRNVSVGDVDSLIGASVIKKCDNNTYILHK